MKNLFLLILCMNLLCMTSFAQVGINVDNSLPHPSAGLDVKFSDKGFLPPRLSLAQIYAIADPAAGLIVYCTDCQPNGSLVTFTNGMWNAFNINCLLPSAPTAGVHVPGAAQISWNWNPVPGATGYKWNLKNHYESATDLGNTTTVTQTGLFCGNTYAIYVWAYNACGASTVTTMTKNTLICCSDPIVDSRDGKTYQVVYIGEQCWFKQNLNYGNKILGTAGDQTNNGIPEKYCFNNDDANCDSRGGLYQWAELVQYLNGATNTALWNPAPAGPVKGLCPDGWHLPAATEYDALITTQGGLTVAGGPLKETGTTYWMTPNTGATNASGFSARSSGMRRSDGLMNTTAFMQNAYFWSATPDLGGSLPNDWSINYRLVYNGIGVTKGGTTKANAFAARCVKDQTGMSNLPSPTPGINVAGQTQIEWNWSTVTGASGYKWNTENNYATATDMGTLTTKTETGLACNTTFMRYVWAYDASGASASALLEQSTTACGTLATVSTNTIVNITANSASGGGNVTNDGGTTVTARGICWSQYPNPTISGDHSTDGSGTGAFTSSLTDLTPNSLYYVRAYATNSAGTAYGDEVTFTTSTGTFVAGQYYQGGIIFYVDGTGLHGLIAATANEGAPTWGYSGFLGTATAIGTGPSNTSTIVTAIATPGIAARVCDELILNGYSDWYLPSKDELSEMYLRKTLIGTFPSQSYWSSSEADAANVWVQNFDDGTQFQTIKGSTCWVRPVRSF